MTCWPVSPRVGNVKNSDPSLIERVCSTLRWREADSIRTIGPEKTAIAALAA